MNTLRTSSEIIVTFETEYPAYIKGFISVKGGVEKRYSYYIDIEEQRQDKAFESSLQISADCGKEASIRLYGVGAIHTLEEVLSDDARLAKAIVHAFHEIDDNMVRRLGVLLPLQHPLNVMIGGGKFRVEKVVDDDEDAVSIAPEGYPFLLKYAPGSDALTLEITDRDVDASTVARYIEEAARIMKEVARNIGAITALHASSIYTWYLLSV